MDRLVRKGSGGCRQFIRILENIQRGEFFVMKLEFVNVNNQSILNYVISQHELNNIPVFRFNSLVMYGYPLDNLQPLQDTLRYLVDSKNDIDGLNVDMYNKFLAMYADQLINFIPSFVDLMRVLSVLQEVDKVIVITNYNHPLVMEIVESLISIIRQRYTLNSFIINDIDDEEPLAYSEFNDDLGYFQYIQDVERYESYVNKPRPNSFNTNPYYGGLGYV